MHRRRTSPWLALALLPLLAMTAGAQEWLNIRLNQDATTQLQNEEQIALNPIDPDNRVAVWRDFRLGYRQVGWGYTFDAGATWHEGGLFVETHYPWQSDPGVTTDALGNFYAIVLSFTSTDQPNGFYVYKSTDGGVSWGPSMEVVNQTPGVFEDKEFIACDRTTGAYRGNLYVCWTRFGFNTDIVMRRSTTGGVSWGSTTTVSDQSSVQFPIPVVGRTGELYIAWTSYASNTIRIDRSTNGGVSFGTDRTVASVYTPSTILNGNIDAYSSPHMDADVTTGPYGGRLYVAFMDRRNSLPDFDIWVTSSDNGGTSWSTPVRINDDAPGNGRDQFFPWLTVDNQGIVTVVFLDRRHDPQNRTYHCYLTQSTDGGTHWLANQRISTEPSDPWNAFGGPPPATDPVDAYPGAPGGHAAAPARITASRAGLLGEYIGVAAWNGVATPVWTDIRNLNQDVYAGYWESGQSVGDDAQAPYGELRLAARPNPAIAGQTITLWAQDAGGAAARAPLWILDASGRLVRTIPGAEGATWNGRGADGRLLAPGVYFLRLPDGASRPLGTLVLLR
jgi:hypothetical protein